MTPIGSPTLDEQVTLVVRDLRDGQAYPRRFLAELLEQARGIRAWDRMQMVGAR